MAGLPESQNMLVILDFDRTIFNTARYYQDFLDMVGEAYGADFTASLDAAQQAEKYFDPFAHCLSQGVDYETVKTQLLAYHDRKYEGAADMSSYLFADAVELIQALQADPNITVGIITTGTSQSQEFKLSQCPELNDIPREIISENKGRRVRRDLEEFNSVHFDGAAYARFALVDDREDVLAQIDPHPNHKLFHIVRPGSKYQPTGNRSDIVKISSLTEILPLLQ
ncbi:MAG: hypothetical protein NVSMB39_2030 [Candidatus Saccharimonadales bacterium]